MDPVITIMQDDEKKYHCQSGLGPVKAIQVLAQVLASMTMALMDVKDVDSDN